MIYGFDKGRRIRMDLFWSKVSIPEVDGCWIWAGARESRYGKAVTTVNYAVAYHKAHRVALSSVLGRELLPGMVTDHLCKNRFCVNPAHLEETTQRTNVTRGGWGDAWRSRQAKTHCKRGHGLTGDNLVVKVRADGKTYRNCRVCLRLAWHRFDAKRRGTTLKK
jgi:hypothetical protein